MKKIYRDSKGTPIKSGDIVKFYHFTALGGETYYMYKGIITKKEQLYTLDLEDFLQGHDDPHTCRLEATDHEKDAEILNLQSSFDIKERIKEFER